MIRRSPEVVGLQSLWRNARWQIDHDHRVFNSFVKLSETALRLILEIQCEKPQTPGLDNNIQDLAAGCSWTQNSNIKTAPPRPLPAVRRCDLHRGAQCNFVVWGRATAGAESPWRHDLRPQDVEILGTKNNQKTTRKQPENNPFLDCWAFFWNQMSGSWRTQWHLFYHTGVSSFLPHISPRKSPVDFQIFPGIFPPLFQRFILLATTAQVPCSPVVKPLASGATRWEPWRAAEATTNRFPKVGGHAWRW